MKRELYEIGAKPKCIRKKCFANFGCECIVLSDNDFGDRPCPFYKTKEQLDAGRRRAKERLLDLKLTQVAAEER